MTATATAAGGAVVVGEVGRFLVPVEERAIVRFFLDSLFVPHTLRERARGLLARGRRAFLWDRCGRLRLGKWSEPLGGEGFAAEGGPWGALLEMVRSTLVSQDGDLLRATPLEGRRLRLLLVRDEARDGVVVFLFVAGEGWPAAVLKLRSGMGPGCRLREEYGALRHLAQRLPAPLRRSVPAVLAFRPVGSLEALLLTTLPGRSAYVEMQARLLPRARVRRHFQEAGAWLAAFHAATRSRDGVFAPEGEEGAVLEGFATSPTGHDADLRWFDDLRRRCASAPLPLVFAHGDFWARNLLLDGSGQGGAGVVDWEHARQDAPPFEDLFHFPLTYGLNTLWSRYRRRPPEEAFRLTFLEQNHVSREVRGYLWRYCAETGLDRGALLPLFHLYLSTGFRHARELVDDGGLWLRFHEMLVRAGRSVFSG